MRTMTLHDLLTFGAKRTSPEKVEVLRRSFERALNAPLVSILAEDSIALRRQLVADLQAQGVSKGNIQHLEQFFMGIVRRAAVEDLIPPPPEGPWTRAWQCVLDVATRVPGGKSAIRSLAGWASAQELQPNQVTPEILEKWAHQIVVPSEALGTAQKVLQLDVNATASFASDTVRMKRLQAKAKRGSVRSARENV